MSAMRVLAAMLVATIASACALVPPAPSPSRPAVPAPVASLAGTWVLTTESPVGSRAADAIFTQNGEQLTGKLTSQRGEVPLAGTVKGDNVAFGMNVNVLGQDLYINYAGTVTGDRMSGTVKFGSFGDGKWSGTRKSH